MIELENALRHAKHFRLHPLGFYYLQTELSDGVKRRIHVWLPSGPSAAENERHQHSFRIDSLVALGRMRSEIFHFELTVDGEVIEFAVSYEDGKSRLRKTGRLGELRLLAAFETNSGNKYSLEAGVIHRITIEQSPCVTILTTTERGIPICSYGVAREEQPFIRRIVDANETSQIARVLIEASTAPDRSRIRG